MANHTELIFILDRSGSMSGLEDDTIGGFNSVIEKQKKEDGTANVTTVLFDNRYELLHDSIDIREIPKLSRKEYCVRGTTALLDAIGRSIVHMEHEQEVYPEKAGKVIAVIITDGMENASREFTMSRVKEMIEEKKKENDWEFIFLGANMDAIKEASRFGIGADRSASYVNDGKGIGKTYAGISKAMTAMRAAQKSAGVGAEWKQEIEDDFNKRHN